MNCISDLHLNKAVNLFFLKLYTFKNKIICLEVQKHGGIGVLGHRSNKRSCRRVPDSWGMAHRAHHIILPTRADVCCPHSKRQEEISCTNRVSFFKVPGCTPNVPLIPNFVLNQTFPIFSSQEKDARSPTAD